VERRNSHDPDTKGQLRTVVGVGLVFGGGQAEYSGAYNTSSISLSCTQENRERKGGGLDDVFQKKGESGPKTPGIPPFLANGGATAGENGPLEAHRE